MKLGPYDLLEVIGRGGMSTVYRGRHLATEQVVAIKVMSADMAADPLLLKRFQQEFSVASRLQHPHIVRGLEFGLEGGPPYLVMEYVEGQNLGQRIKRHGPLPQDEAVRLILQVADALQVAHEHRLIHRDVKPDNILLTTDNTAKLTDLGLSKDLAGGGELTRPRTCLGTLSFMAPEQCEDARRVDARCDIYSLGATLYFALTGIVPFPGRGNLTILRKKLNHDYVPAERKVPGLKPHIDRAIRAALSASPSDRPSSMKVFAELLSTELGPPLQVEHPADVTAVPTAEEKSQGPSDDRRISPRYPSALEASCRPLQDPRHQWNGEIQDVSTTGVRLQVSRRFEPGCMLTVEFVDEVLGQISERHVRVHWVRQAEDRQWRLGCAFSRELSDGELNTLLGGHPTVVVHGDA